MKFAKRLIPVMCTALLLLSNAACSIVYADPHGTDTPSGSVISLDQHTDENGITVSSHMDSNWPSIISKAAVVMDMTTGTVVYEKEPLAPHFPASITKILTAKVALDRGKLDDTLTTSELATKQDGNRVYLVKGEQEPLEKLLYGLLLDSGNDAAVVIAEHYGGSVSGFAQIMNQTARALGATHSHFDNPNGLPDPNHTTCAYDMAVIARAAMQNPEFRKIVSTKTYDWHGQAWDSTLVNLNHMLFNYPGAIGIKTGYTLVANETLVVAAKRGNTTFLAVLMDAPLDREIRSDATQLLDYAFAHYETQSIYPKGDVVGHLQDPTGHQVALATTDDVYATEPKGSPLQFKSQVEGAPPATSKPANAPVDTLRLTTDSGSDYDIPLHITDSYTIPEPPHTTRIWIGSGVTLVVLAPLLALLTRAWLARRREDRRY